MAEHRGRLFKLRGDGLLVAFGSVVDAVGRTLSIQRALAAHEAGAAEPLRLRIRVNLGVVESEAGGLFGEGVIIAARLQVLAEPAGILVSGTVFDHLQGQLDCGLEVLGERRLENIDRPPGLSADDRRCRASTRAGRHGTDRPLVAVVPFDNRSVDPDQAYFTDGISEEFITELSRFRELLVIARNSSFAYP